MKRLLILSLVLSTYLSAQNPPPPPQGPPPNGPEGRPGERSPHRPFAEMLKRHIDGKSPLDKLSEADRKRILGANAAELLGLIDDQSHSVG